MANSKSANSSLDRLPFGKKSRNCLLHQRRHRRRRHRRRRCCRRRRRHRRYENEKRRIFRFSLPGNVFRKLSPWEKIRFNPIFVSKTCLNLFSLRPE